MNNIIIFTRYNRKPDYRDAHVALSNEAWGILRKFIIESVPGNICPVGYGRIEDNYWIHSISIYPFDMRFQDNKKQKISLEGNKKFKFAPHCAMLNGGVSCSYISEGPLFK